METEWQEVKRWPTKPLGELIAIEKGKKAPNAFATLTRTSLRYLQIEDLRPNPSIKYCEPFNCPTVTKSDVIIAWDGANAGTVSCNLTGHIGSTLAVLRPIETSTLSPLFLSRFLQGNFDYLQQTATGATIPHVSKDALNRLQIPVPPLEEQERLVRLLDEADGLRKLRDEAACRTADFIPSLFHEMLGDPATNPKAWPVSTFADHLELLEYGPRFYNEAYSETGPRIVRITDLDREGNLNFSTMPRQQVDSTTFDARGLKPGELVFARSGATVGKVAVVPDDAPACIAGAYFIRLRFESSIHPVYAAYLIRCPSVQGIIMNNSRQSAQQNFSGPGIRSLPLPVPPLPLQKEFAARVSEIRAMQVEQIASRRRFNDLFQSLLHRAFRGEL